MATKDSQAPAVTLAGTTYRLRFDYGALCELCDALDVDLSTMQDRMARIRPSEMHLPLWAGMLDQAPTITPDEVKALLKPLDIPDAQAVLGSAMDAFAAAMVRQEKGKAGKESPQTPATDPAR